MDRALRIGLAVLAVFLSCSKLNSQELGPKALVVGDHKNLAFLLADVDVNNTAKLKRDAIITRIELRMRAVGIKPQKVEADYVEYLELLAYGSDGRPEESSGLLLIDVAFVKSIFSIHLTFIRPARIILPGDNAHLISSVVYLQNTVGTHGNSATFVLDAVQEQLDKFLNQFLKANQ